ncbi:PEP-CTERM sorting domain-containing protein [Alteromonas gracilis]|uniref:PEP-CTERM sorting domain-containing protein n=1 Tax=Alteromonas gracilis TaxID=1479524 RepID=UPI002FE41AA0
MDPAEQESEQAEQNGKRLAEQQAKTQTESGNKEALAKNVVATGGSVDDKPTVAVNAPTSLSLLGLGAVAAVWLKRKREQQG